MSKVLLIALVTTLAFSKFATSDLPVISHLSQGGYRSVGQAEFKKLSAEELSTYNEIQNFIRSEFETQQNSNSLGEVLGVATQIVSGVNYRYTFATEQGSSITVTVWDQPWTQTRKITDISAALE